MDFPILSEFWWSTDILSSSIFLQGVDQKILPCGQGRIDCIKINPSLLMMRECQMQALSSLCCVNSERLATGVVTSPNHPDDYPHNHWKTQTLIAEQGLILALRFTAFDIHYDSRSCPNCACDHLTIIDGDGTILMGKSCGNPSDGVMTGGQLEHSSLPADIRSRSHVVNFIFETNGKDARPGWSVTWSAMAPGEVLKVLENISHAAGGGPPPTPVVSGGAPPTLVPVGASSPAPGGTTQYALRSASSFASEIGQHFHLAVRWGQKLTDIKI